MNPSCSGSTGFRPATTLAKTARTLTRLARFDSFLAGDDFGAADVAAACHFPMARMVARQTLDFDPLTDVPGVDDYLARLEARPTVQRIRADHRAALPGFLSHVQQLFAGRSGSA